MNLIGRSFFFFYRIQHRWKPRFTHLPKGKGSTGPDNIISIIKSAIDGFDETTESRSVGTVVEVGDGIAQVYGLDGALSSELIEFPGGVMGMALNLEEETVGCVILGDATASLGRPSEVFCETALAVAEGGRALFDAAQEAAG